MYGIARTVVGRVTGGYRTFDSYLAGGAAGRDEARDFLDILDLNRRTLPLGALCWAAAGKDPGFTPFALLEILRRRGKYHQEDFARLHLTAPVDLPTLKAHWLAALAVYYPPSSTSAVVEPGDNCHCDSGTASNVTQH